MADYSTLPSGATLKVTPYNVHIDQQKLDDMKQLIKLSPLGPKTYENQQDSPDRRLGVSMKWMQQAKESWTGSFDW
jgi:microsomal epoxide hydrolase